jgi:predicted glycoside hydrolase/deacetylase ChbG (UPF0249 family)
MNELRQLVVNADDYGMTKNISLGIREAHQQGIVTTTTAIMTAPAISQELALAQELCPQLGIGVHLVLTSGPPIRPPSKVPSLIRNDGRFYEFKEISLCDFNLDQVYDEWCAQIDTFLETDIPLSHLDSHYHISYFNKDIFELMLRLASLYAVPVRFPPEKSYQGQYHPVELLESYDIGHPDQLITSFHKEGATQEQMIEILQNLHPGTSEIMCHPGYSDKELEARESYSRIREQELAVLIEPSVVSAVSENNITLSAFSALGS